MWVAVLVGCGQLDGVRWDAVGSADAVQDVAVGFIALGLVQETDGGLLRATHPAGAALRIRARDQGAFGGENTRGWTANATVPDVLDVARQTETDQGLELNLRFASEGQSLLKVFDADGVELDTEVIRVRAVAEADVFAYEELARELTRPLDTLDVVVDDDATFVVTWRASDGEALAGGGLLAVEAPEGLAVEAGFDGTTDTLRVTAATPGRWTLGLQANGADVRTLDVVAHARDEVDFVGLELGPSTVSRRTGGYVDGTVFAVVRAGDTPVSGAEVVFDWGTDAGVGDTLDFAASAGPATEVDVCFDAVCNTFPLPAGVASVSVHEADLEPGHCGCAETGGPSGALGLGLAAAVGFRRRRGPLSGAKPSAPSPRCSP